jgi:iron complex transport system permease protein
MSVAARVFPGFRQRPEVYRTRLVFAGLIALLSFVLFLAIDKGAVEISLAQCASIIARRIGLHLPYSFDTQQEATLLYIRLPRVVLGLIVGAALGVTGAAMQGLFRNPLADPSLIGISSGAALAATIVIVVGDAVAFSAPHTLKLFALPIAAFGGGLVTTLLVYRLATISGQTVVATLLLAGIAINALAQAFSGLLTYYATDTQIRSITFWKLGSLGGATWDSVLVATPFILVPVLFFPRLARALNTLLLGEAEAGHLGVSIETVKRLTIIFVALAVGASVAVTGIITFVGLVVPHLLRLLMGPDHRRLLPSSALLGAILLLASDLVARTIVAPAELPIGIVTALIGAPFFLWLLLRDRKWRVIH